MSMTISRLLPAIGAAALLTLGATGGAIAKDAFHGSRKAGCTQPGPEATRLHELIISSDARRAFYDRGTAISHPAEVAGSEHVTEIDVTTGPGEEPKPVRSIERTTAWVQAVAAAAPLSAPYGSASGADTLKIGVIGGNGMIGQRVVREALDRGHQVTAIVRDPARVAEKHERLAVERGDVLDRARIAKLAADQDVLVSAVGSARAKSPDPTLYRKAAESLVHALRDLGESAPRLIVVGGVGSLEDASGKVLVERMPPDRQPESLGQKAALDYYRTIADVNWTYFSPAGRIAPGDRTGVFRLGEDRLIVDGNGESRISMEDYAVALIDEAERPQHTRRRFTIGY